MAKKKKGKVIQMLSPEKYIRQKARQLPIFECRVNSDWTESRKANIMVARKHSNENITFGTFLVDLNCLGLINTLHVFNISPFDYREIIDSAIEDFDVEVIPYALAHNIIFAGIEFAEDYNFKPHKDFALTQYLLEEDTDDIELIDIHCGDDEGKPLYVQAVFENQTRVNQIIGHLEKYVGSGNYGHIIENEEMVEEDSELDMQMGKYYDLPINERIELIYEFLDNDDSIVSDTEMLDFQYLRDSVIDELVDYKKVEKYLVRFLDLLSNSELDYNVSDDVLGIEPGSKIDREVWQKQFNEIFDSILNNAPKALSKLKTYKDKMPDNPAVCFLDLLYKQNNEQKDFEKTLLEYHKRFPDYRLINMLMLTNFDLFSTRFNTTVLLDELLPRIVDNKKLCRVELIQLIFSTLMSINQTNDIDLVKALEWFFEETESERDYLNPFQNILDVAKIEFILGLKNNLQKSFTFKIQLKNVSKPPVWRRVKVPAQYTFSEFHQVIQLAMGWYNQHLFEFSPKGYQSYPQIKLKFDDDLDDDWFESREILDAETTYLTDIFYKKGQRYTYIYDLGNNWQHSITLEEILEENQFYPQLLAGKGQCPPEDSGGTCGYESLKEVMLNPKDTEYESYADWLGLKKDEKWDASYFDIELKRKLLHDVFTKNIHENEE